MRAHLKITPAVVISTLALAIVASGGTAYAASKIGSAEIRDNSIRGKDIRSNEVRSSDIKDGALRARDFAPGTLRTGPTGAKGATGPAGPKGAPGANGGRWLLVDKDGAIIAQSGGFSINAAYAELPNTAVEPAPSNALRAAGNVYIDANENLSNNAITVTIALQNQLEQDSNANTNGRAPGPDANAEFSGEITSTVCGVTGIVACAPPGSNNRDHFVVSPRLSDGSVTTAANHKRFYVVITGDSSDYVAPGTPAPAVALP